MEKKRHDFLFREELRNIDPEVLQLIKLEEERQVRKLIFIPSESTAPASVRYSLSSVLQNLYAEGYPPEYMQTQDENQILDYEQQLAIYKRYSDPRYYKGVEFADVLESLAKRRCAEAFCPDSMSPEELFVNVQALSGAPANNAVYQALITPGTTIMGMDLFHGGHLSHGSPVNRSGKLYNAIHYAVDPETEKIDYQQVRALALQHQPKIIICGYSSYPWIPDWQEFRAIADEVGAYMFADISHIAGLIAARVVPSPVGIADVITFTTHKTLCGPRGACIVTKDASIAKKIDKAVFPGEQGGPHVQVFAAMATTFKIAQSEQFHDLQQQILLNCKAMGDQLQKRGIRLAFQGTDSHLLNIDCKSIKGEDGAVLSGDIAARILDLVGIVANRNTIPGDVSAFKAGGVRLGTPWVTQRGLKENDLCEIADVIADTLQATHPYYLPGGKSKGLRAKVDFSTFEDAKTRIRTIAYRAGTDLQIEHHGYPFFSYIDDYSAAKIDETTFSLRGEKIRSFLNYALVDDIEQLKTNEIMPISVMIDGKKVAMTLALGNNWDEYFATLVTQDAGPFAAWLRDLSDGFVHFDPDLTRKLPGPVIISETTLPDDMHLIKPSSENLKPYHIGQVITGKDRSLPEFAWKEKDDDVLKRTCLYQQHVVAGAQMVPFAGWEMPVWYTSVVEEHKAVRANAGLFDVSHMGVFMAEGVDAVAFLDSVCANDISALEIGESCYTHFLDADGHVIDDTIVYRYAPQEYLVVVNASNEHKDWAWFQAVKDGSVLIERHKPWSVAYGRNVILHNLKNPAEGKGMRVDIALQGPTSRQILIKLGWDEATLRKINALKRTQLCVGTWQNTSVIISRTGYTGEKMAFELFIHPEKAPLLWDTLLEKGTDLGLKPCGLGARDSLRTEAGLPLYGHEMGGDLNLGVNEAGFALFVKVHKPWFIGRDAYIASEEKRKGIVIRFRFDQQRVKMAHSGDPVMDERGKVIGVVTSCAIDKEEYLTGQAFVDNKYAAEGTSLLIYQNKENLDDVFFDSIKTGSRVALPSSATVVSRFMK
ncbi:MAG TPA: glycine cleavage system aminomethyltransferase GcvT [Anaerolineaceae bacterium]|uniref:Aminomethyltransferase n=1 Tax=Anaerolinea thermophila TaxID=167964 RepID=A0A117LH12_9CHLR|nr:MAG: Aminomethyltransferase [Anaerolinea thermophila]HAF61521.1 glycine cleavage system aminomethyltransferase GcvT [Anaerolineaceae bacterium]